MAIFSVLSHIKSTAMRNIKALFAYFLIATSIIACQKEPDESILDEPQLTCTLQKAEIMDGSGGIEDSGVYTYTNSMVSKIEFTNLYYTFQYTGTKVSRRNYYTPGVVAPIGYDNVTYNGDGTVQKVETFIGAPGLPNPILVLGFDFVYTGGKLTRWTEKIDSTGSGQPLIPYYEYNYTYTGNNITRYIENDIFGNIKDTVDFQFDNVANHFAKNPNALFTDIFFNELNGQLAPFVFSANNVIKLSGTGGDLNIGYTLDNNKNLKELLVEGQVASRYTYKCN